MPLSPTRTCSFTGVINPLPFLSSLVPSPRVIDNIRLGNASLPHAGCLPSMAQGVGSELADWAAAIGRAQVVRIAGQRVPGAAHLHTAYQIYRTLTEAQRGNLLASLRHVPLTALLPAACLAVLRQSLQSLLPSAVQNAPDHEPLVLALAIGAWLYDLTGTDERASSAPQVQRVVDIVRGLRAGLNALRGMRNILALPAPATDVPTLGWSGMPRPGPARPPLPVNATGVGELALVDARAHVRGLLPGFGLAPADAYGSAWPMPGADAARRGRPKARPRPPKPAPAARAGAAGASGRRASATLRLTPARNAVRRPGDDWLPPPRVGSVGAARNPAAMSANAGTSSKQAMPSLSSDTAGEKARAREAARDQHTGARTHVTAQAGGTTAPTAITSAEDYGAAPEDTVATLSRQFLPPCIRAAHAPAVAAQLRKTRHWTTPLRFCIAHDAVERFKDLLPFTDACAGEARTWSTTELLREEIPLAMRGLHVQRFGGLGALAAGTAVDSEPLGTDAMFSAVSISLWRPSNPADTPPAQLPWLQRNTFRIMQHTGLGGTRQHLIAYFVNQQHGDTGGVRAGFLRVHDDMAGQVSVEDTVHRLTVSAETLEGLVDGLQEVTGMRYLPPDDSLAAPADLPEGAVLAEPLSNLLVNAEETLSWQAPHDHLDCSTRAEVFAPVSVQVEGEPQPFRLYFNSFIRCGDHLVYADRNGNSGALRFGPEMGRHGRRILEGRTPEDTEFAIAQAIRLGAVYNPTDVIDRLKQMGMLQLPAPSQPTASSPARFRFADSTLTYTDADGQRGEVRFLPVTTAEGVRYQLDPRERGANILVRPTFQQDERYSEAEIAWMLLNEGFTTEGESQRL